MSLSIIEDPSFAKQNIALTESEASARHLQVKDVSYELCILMPKDKPYFRGSVKITFTLAQVQDLFVDFHGQSISKFQINGQEAKVVFQDHRIKFNGCEELLKAESLNQL
jgi:hypothetical protein